MSANECGKAPSATRSAVVHRDRRSTKRGRNAMLPPAAGMASAPKRPKPEGYVSDRRLLVLHSQPRIRLAGVRTKGGRRSISVPRPDAVPLLSQPRLEEVPEENPCGDSSEINNRFNEKKQERKHATRRCTGKKPGTRSVSEGRAAERLSFLHTQELFERLHKERMRRDEELRRRKETEELARIRREAEFHAQPINRGRPLIIKMSTRMTIPESPKLHTRERAERKLLSQKQTTGEE